MHILIGRARALYGVTSSSISERLRLKRGICKPATETVSLIWSSPEASYAYGYRCRPVIGGACGPRCRSCLSSRARRARTTTTGSWRWPGPGLGQHVHQGLSLPWRPLLWDHKARSLYGRECGQSGGRPAGSRKGLWGMKAGRRAPSSRPRATKLAVTGHVSAITACGQCDSDVRPFELSAQARRSPRQPSHQKLWLR